MENLNQNYSNEIQSEIKRWNWGAFMFNVIWGIGNKSYLPLLCLIPFFNFIWVFVCGVKGNEWAWKKGNYSSVDEFRKVQATWNRAGLASFIFTVVVMLLYIFLFISIAAGIKQTYIQVQ